MKRTAKSRLSSTAIGRSKTSAIAHMRTNVGLQFNEVRNQHPRQDLADQARARLEEMIVSLELPPGSVWSEAQLSAKLHIGRTPVREALQRLEAETSRHNRDPAWRASHRNKCDAAATAA
jgi:hypothetical protein